MQYAITKYNKINISFDCKNRIYIWMFSSHTIKWMPQKYFHCLLSLKKKANKLILLMRDLLISVCFTRGKYKPYRIAKIWTYLLQTLTRGENFQLKNINVLPTGCSIQISITCYMYIDFNKWSFFNYLVTYHRIEGTIHFNTMKLYDK